jgi:hypothetical protein
MFKVELCKSAHVTSLELYLFCSTFWIVTSEQITLQTGYIRLHQSDVGEDRIVYM